MTMITNSSSVPGDPLEINIKYIEPAPEKSEFAKG